MHYTSFVRFIERFAGTLVCLLFSLLHALRPRPKNKTIRNILIIELVEMGAAVMAYSSLKYIRKQIPDARIFSLCLASKKDSWLVLDEVPRENVFVIDDRSFGLFLRSSNKCGHSRGKA